jgi:hypothetical protein
MATKNTESKATCRTWRRDVLTVIGFEECRSTLKMEATNSSEMWLNFMLPDYMACLTSKVAQN